MKKFKKPLKFYLIMFLILILAVAGYSIYKVVSDNTPVSELISLWILPVIFILVYYGSDSLLDLLFNKKKKIDYEAEFIEKIAGRMRDSNEFLVEDYRRLQINEKFQDSLKMAYQIFLNGEDDIFNIPKLERKFKKETIEYKAMKYVIEYLEESKKPID